MCTHMSNHMSALMRNRKYERKYKRSYEKSSFVNKLGQSKKYEKLQICAQI